MTAEMEEKLMRQSQELIEYLNKKSGEASKLGEESHANFLITTAYTLGSLIGYELKPTGYGPMMATIIDATARGLETAMQDKGVNGTIIRVKKE